MNQLLHSPYENTVEPQNHISTSLWWGGGHNLSVRLVFPQPKASCNTNSLSHSNEMALLTIQSHYVPLHLILIILLDAHLRNLPQQGLTSPQAPFLFQKPLQFNFKPHFFRRLHYPPSLLTLFQCHPICFSYFYSVTRAISVCACVEPWRWWPRSFSKSFIHFQELWTYFWDIAKTKSIGDFQSSQKHPKQSVVSGGTCQRQTMLVSDCRKTDGLMPG